MDTNLPPPHAVLRTLCARLAGATGLTQETVAAQLRPPPDPKLGDYAFPCFALAKQRRTAPPKLAAELGQALRADAALAEVCEGVQAEGAFLNFRVRPGALCAAVLEPIRAAGSAYGHSTEGQGRTIVVDYSSPNIAKPFHVAHLMSTILGASLVRLFRALGYTVVGVNHLGDWGTQCGYQFLAWQQADPAEREKRLAEEGLDYLAELYVAINAPARTVQTLENESLEEHIRPEDRLKLEAELARVKPQADELEKSARALFKKLEDGDRELRALWERFRATTLRVLQKSYDRLGVHFESDAGEAFYEPLLKPLVEDLKARGVLIPSEGAWVIPLCEPGDKQKRVPFIVVKSDGGTKYETRDLAAAIYRKQTYNFAQNLYVVDVRQHEHFDGLFKALARSGYDWSTDCRHISYGIMKIKEGDDVLPMTTRGGRMIPLGELLDRMVGIVQGIVQEKNPELPAEHKARVAEAVGVGAIIFWVQARRRESNIIFDWKLATSPDGDTGPYLQYTHARSSSILRKFGQPIPAADLRLLVAPEEVAVAKALESFPAVVRQAATVWEPSLVATYLLVLARTFNDFYNKHQVLKSEPALRDARLVLVDAVRTVLAQGLGLLGLAAPEEM